MSKAELQMPSAEQIETELRRTKRSRSFGKYIRSTLYIITGIAAIAILISSLLLPVIRVYSDAMAPAVTEGEVAVSIRLPSFQRGDIIAFYYNNRVLVRRVIAVQGDVVALREDGAVLVNNVVLDEPYVEQLDLGGSDVEFPLKVNEETYFVLGDNRVEALDSRHEVVGLVKKEDVLGKLLFTVWPFDKIKAH